MDVHEAGNHLNVSHFHGNAANVLVSDTTRKALKVVWSKFMGGRKMENHHQGTVE